MAIALSGTGSWNTSGKKLATFTVANVQTTGTNRGLLVFCMGATKNGTENISTVTFNSVSMSSLTGHYNGNQHCQIWYTSSEPADTTASVVVTPSDTFWSNAGGVVIAVALNGVDTATFVENLTSATGSGGSPSVTCTSSSGDWVVGGLSHAGSATITPGTGDTELQDVTANSCQGVVNYDPSTGATETCNWSGASTTWVADAVNVIEAAATIERTAGVATTTASGVSVTESQESTAGVATATAAGVGVTALYTQFGTAGVASATAAGVGVTESQEATAGVATTTAAGVGVTESQEATAGVAAATAAGVAATESQESTAGVASATASGVGVTESQEATAGVASATAAGVGVTAVVEGFAPATAGVASTTASGVGATAELLGGAIERTAGVASAAAAGVGVTESQEATAGVASAASAGVGVTESQESTAGVASATATAVGVTESQEAVAGVASASAAGIGVTAELLGAAIERTAGVATATAAGVAVTALYTQFGTAGIAAVVATAQPAASSRLGMDLFQPSLPPAPDKASASPLRLKTWHQDRPELNLELQSVYDAVADADQRITAQVTPLPHRLDALERSVKTAHPYTPQRYGAKTGGEIDCTAAIQRAVDEAQAAGIGEVFFPAGTYLVDSSVTVTGNGISLFSAGGAILKASFNATSVLRISGNFCRVWGLVFHGGKNAASTVQDAIYLDGANDCTVDACVFTGPAANTGFSFGVEIVQGDRNVVANSRFARLVSTSANGTAVVINQGNYNIVDNCFIDSSEWYGPGSSAGAAIQLTTDTVNSCQYNVIRRNVILNHKQAGISVGSSSYTLPALQPCQYNVIERNDVSGCSAAGGGDASTGILILGNQNYNVVRGNRVHDNGHPTAGGYGIALASNQIALDEYPEWNDIVDNEVYLNQDHGLYNRGGPNNHFRRNRVYDNGQRTANTFSNFEIQPQGTLTAGGCRVYDNIFGGTQVEYHIQVGSAVTSLTLGPNELPAAGTKDIETNGAAVDIGLTYHGSGTPESAVVALPGCLYINRAGGVATTLYVKETGTGNTGWAGK